MSAEEADEAEPAEPAAGLDAAGGEAGPGAAGVGVGACRGAGSATASGVFRGVASSASSGVTLKTVAHLVQRILTPRGGTFSSATRKRARQLVHWTIISDDSAGALAG